MELSPLWRRFSHPVTARSARKGRTMSSLYTIDQLKWFSDRLEEDGYTAEQFNLLGQGGRLTAMLGVIRGTHEIRPIGHIIDLAVPCKLPFNGAERVSPAKSGVVKLERRGDDLYLDGKKIELFRSAGQQGDRYIVGHELRKELEAKGGNVSGSILDHLVAHPELWPESWKRDENGNTIFVYFWDDIFRSSDGGLCVRCGYWGDGKVVSDCHWLDRGWYRYGPSASIRTTETFEAYVAALERI